MSCGTEFAVLPCGVPSLRSSPHCSARCSSSRRTRPSTPAATGCAGTQVKRCLWFNHDSTYNRLRAYAWVADVDGGRNYNVAVSRVHLQVWTSSGWRVVSNSTGTDYDGWHAVRDDAHGPLVSCANGYRFTVRSVAYFQWQGDPSFSGWLAGPAATFTC